jgi:hypothetical protein
MPINVQFEYQISTAFVTSNSHGSWPITASYGTGGGGRGVNILTEVIIAVVLFLYPV